MAITIEVSQDYYYCKGQQLHDSYQGNVQGLPETSSALSTLPSLFTQAASGGMTEILELLSKTIREDYLEGPYPDEIQSRTGSFRKTFRRGQAGNIFRVEAGGRSSRAPLAVRTNGRAS